VPKMRATASAGRKLAWRPHMTELSPKPAHANSRSGPARRPQPLCGVGHGGSRDGWAPLGRQGSASLRSAIVQPGQDDGCDDCGVGRRGLNIADQGIQRREAVWHHSGACAPGRLVFGGGLLPMIELLPPLRPSAPRSWASIGNRAWSDTGRVGSREAATSASERDAHSAPRFRGDESRNCRRRHVASGPPCPDAPFTAPGLSR
jgi:hypothetical protein